MARDLFIDLTNRRLVASEQNSAPIGSVGFTKGDNGTFNLYFLEATGIINRPFEIVDKSNASIKFGIGSRTETPTSGTWSLTFGGDTATGVSYAATAGAVQTALNSLTAISSAGGVTVEGAIDTHFTVRFNTAGTRGPITANVSELIPESLAVIDERIAGSASVKEVQEIQLRLTPAVYQPTWTNLSTAVTATIATTTTGSTTLNEVQRLTFSQKPYEGTYRLSFPATTFTSTSTVTSGVFITTANHGLALDQPITITGFSVITGYTRGTIYYVKSTPEPRQFTVAATAGGTLITGSATAISSGTISTVLRQTAPINANATAADVEAALEALDSIGTDGVIVSGIQGQYYDITFNGQKGYADQPAMTVESGLSAKNGKTADINFSTFSLRDALGNDTSSDLELEIEITESGKRTTVVLGSCTVSEELIDGNALVPSFVSEPVIYKTLTAPARNLVDSLVAITGLNWTAQPNSQYLVEWGLLLYNEADDDFNAQVTAPNGATIYGFYIVADQSGANYKATNVPLSSNGELATMDADEQTFSFQKAHIKTGTTGGEVKFLFSKNTLTNPGLASEIMTGSWVRAEKIS